MELDDLDVQPYSAIIAGLVALFLVGIINFPTIDSWYKEITQPESFYFNLKETDIETEAVDYKRNKGLYVPNYKANICIKPDKEKVELEKSFSFNVRIEDIGYVNMSYPYYYVLLESPNEKIKAIFPYDHDLSKYHKWDSWEGYRQTDNELNFNYEGESYEISRRALIKGKGTIGKSKREKLIKFRHGFKESAEVGRWRIHIFLFDSEPYVDREGNELETSTNDAVAYRGMSFDVVTEKETSEKSVIGDILLNVTIFTAFFVPLYGFLSWKYTRNLYLKIKKYIKENKVPVTVWIISVLFILLLYLLS